jgi:hypothetical protein
MPTSISFWDHPLDKLEEALSIRKQIAALQSKLSGLFGSEDSETPTPATQTRKPTKKGKRTMSPEARERIAAAQRARWAKQKGTATSTPQTAKTPKKKGGLTPEGRAKLAASMKARWAARKKGAPALNATAASTVARKPKAKRNVSPEARAKMAEAARKRWAAVKAK